MTEIKIEKKKLVWPWILLGLIVLAVLIYFLAFYDSNGKSDEYSKTSEQMNGNDSKYDGTEESDLINVNENNGTVADYVNFVETHKNKMGLDHEYTNEAILKLVKATNAIAREVEYVVRVDMDKVKEYAEIITEDPNAITHADYIRKAADILTDVLQNIQKAKYPGLTNGIAELRNATESIKPGVQTLNQRDEVKTFFSKSAELLKKMN